MPRRKVVLSTGEIYHVFNRSIAKENLFSSRVNFRKAIEVAAFYRLPQIIRLSKFKNLNKEAKEAYLNRFNQTTPLVEIYAYAFMPNHYHFLLRQLQDSGISQFISNFQNSFAKTFNLINTRTGSLFQNQFKAVRPETDEELLHISRYIHLNPVTAYMVKFEDLEIQPNTSFGAYMGRDKILPVETQMLTNLAGSRETYRQFVEDQVEYQRTLDLVKHLILE